MNEEIKQALEQCNSGSSCDGCPYFDESDCNEKIKNEAYDAIISLEATVSYMAELNNKLSQELQNSLGLKKSEE